MLRQARFHPANYRLKEIVQSGELGKIKSINARFCVPNIADDNNIRCDFNLGGGSYMDQGCKNLNARKFLD